MSSIHFESFVGLSFSVVSLVYLEVLFLYHFIKEEKLRTRGLSFNEILKEVFMYSNGTLVVLSGMAFTVE